MAENEVKKPINLSKLQFRPVMSYCLYLTVINIISDAFLRNRQPLAFSLLDPGT